MAYQPEKRRCGVCGVEPGALHQRGCSAELCAKCGDQFISCECKRRNVPRLAWTGIWPGVVEAIEFDWWERELPGAGYERCASTDEGALPDVERVRLEARWDPVAKRFMRE